MIRNTINLFGVFVLLVLFFSHSSAFGQNVEYEAVKTLRGHSKEVQNLRFSPDGKLLATCSHDNTIIIWDVASGTLIRRLWGHTDQIHEVTFNSKGDLLASGSRDGTAKVWEVKTGKLVGTYYNKPYYAGVFRHVSVSFVFFSADGKNIFFSGDNGYIMKARVDIPDQQAEFFFSTNHTDGSWYSTVTGGTLSADGKNLVISVGNHLMVIDAATAKMVRSAEYTAEGFNDVVVVPDGKSLAAWTFDGKVSMWDYATMRMTKRFDVALPNNYSAATFSKDAKYLATGAHQNVVRVWDVKTGKEISSLVGHSKVIRTVRFSPTEHLLATASYDGTAKIWKIKEKTDEVAKDPIKDTPKEVVTVVVRDTIRVKDTVFVEKKVETSIADEDLKVGNTIRLKNIQFKQGEPTFLPESYPELQRLHEVMLKNPKMVIELSGHTDNVGGKTLNYKLSLDRVEAVKKYLVALGVAEDRIRTKAYGGDFPIADNNKEETRKLNRRVEVTIVSL